ncbi:hypothetical protein OSB04_017166 [Centaurea solstitialis]|uniref:Uncharacterized protein n=1 Tax=Centaurea solstitialis TaxID=347529 RepID=A0AA38TDD7_9ASTR|nr:hypothetical protein OSB04_017166 [Centaurea solstitialis]
MAQTTNTGIISPTGFREVGGMDGMICCVGDEGSCSSDIDLERSSSSPGSGVKTSNGLEKKSCGNALSRSGRRSSNHLGTQWTRHGSSLRNAKNRTRKDIERTFATIQEKCHVVDRPARA